MRHFALRLHYGHGGRAIRHVTVYGSPLQHASYIWQAVVELYEPRLKGLHGNDREERGFVSYQRAARQIELSTHSAEQAVDRCNQHHWCR